VPTGKFSPADVELLTRLALERGGTVGGPPTFPPCGVAYHDGDCQCGRNVIPAVSQGVAASLVAQLKGNDWTKFVVEAARDRGWLVVSFRTARTGREQGWTTPILGDKGFPDVVLVGRGKLIFAECKTGAGRLTKHQREWKKALIEAGALWYEWRPEDWPEIERLLR
jgi:hypothetical protein